MATAILPDGLWKRLEPLLPNPRENRHVQFAGRKPSDLRRVVTGILFVLRTGIPLRHLPDSPACATFVNGKGPEFGSTFLKSCLRTSRPSTKSIGIAPSWTLPRYGLRAEAKKPAQIP